MNSPLSFQHLKMESIKTFLESSTIHGLTYISTTRKYVRLFWILVVVSGFTGAGVIIYQSFQSWEESPVKTTLETRPITEMMYPKVTVCPPKNTHTILNYYLELTENMTIDDSTRKELAEYALEVIQDQVYEEVMSNISLINEENLYHNWYFGQSKISLPFWGEVGKGWCDFSWCKKVSLKHLIVTSANSGVISTQYFGEAFNKSNLHKSFLSAVLFYKPSEVLQNENVTFHIQINRNELRGVDKYLWGANDYDDDVQNKIYNFTPPQSFGLFAFLRDVSEYQFNVIKMDFMPGFTIQWKYSSKNQEILSNYFNDDSSVFKKFVFVNISSFFYM